MRLARAFAVPILFCQIALADSVIAIYPSPANVIKEKTTQFTTYITVSPATVNWSVNGMVGGNATYGTVSPAGLYTAPAVIPMANVVDVRATSTAMTTVYGASAVTISQPTPWVLSTSPNAFTTGTGRKLSINGSGLMPQSVVNVNGVPWTTTYSSPTSISATGDLPTAGTFAVTVTQPNPGGLVSQPVNITVTTAPPAPITVAVLPSSVSSALAATTQFTATVTGSGNTAVTWKASAGSITPAGLYSAPANMPANSSVIVMATSSADSTKSSTATVTLQNAGGGGTPGNNGADLTQGRFLEQAAFGPSPQDLANVHTRGISGWLDDQLAMAETPINLPAQSSSIQSNTLNRLATAPDQLRQKMAWALGQFIVISMNKNYNPNEYVPYLQILSRNAFGNFRTLLGDIATSPQMGKYLDLANSNKAKVGGGGANENFARELMQLFTIGLVQLNIDGSPTLAGGATVPTYTQPDIVQTAAALTGWTFPTAAGSLPQSNNWENFSASNMETRPANHDTSSKTLINGCVLPAGQTVQQDMDGVLDCVFNHANTAPFVATRLIRSLVTSNPSPAFITRIAQVFNDNGKGTRGDLAAVLRAILTDSEARQDTPTLNGGRLKDPVFFIVSFVRAMNGTIVPATVIPWSFVAMGEPLNTPASVFGYYSPFYRIPQNPTLFGPEFQIYTPTESVEEANMLYQIVNQPNSDPSIDLSPFNAVAGNTAQLLDLVDQKLLYGRMPTAMRTSIAPAVDAAYGNAQRVAAALYLTAISGQYQTQF